MSVFDFLTLGSFLFLRSFAHSGSALLVVDYLNPDSPLLPRSFTRYESSPPAHGKVSFGSVMSMSLLDFLSLGSFSSARSFARFESAVSQNTPRLCFCNVSRL